LRHQGQLHLIDSISLEEISRELSTTEKNQSLNTGRCQTSHPLSPTGTEGQPTMKSLFRCSRSQQPTLKRLLKKAPVRRKRAVLADHHSNWLGRTALTTTLSHEV
tara:strand:+ start:392 stop:706 length:315 start_codon:yes stop_codon:yes gene_type:complete